MEFTWIFSTDGNEIYIYIYRKHKPQHVKVLQSNKVITAVYIKCVCGFLFLKEPDMGAIARKEVENYTKAKDRYQDALKELKSQRLKDHERQNRWAAS